MDNYNYPMGSDTPDAPWNQKDLDEKDFNVCISQTLSKSTSVCTNDYYLEGGYLDAEDGGGYVEDVNTSETDWKKAYDEEHYTPLQLIQELKFIAEAWLKGEEIIPNQVKVRKLIEECSDWVEDETEVIEN